MKRLLVGLTIATGICSLADFANGQESRGTIIGRVTDPTGGVVPGARVEVLNVATNTAVASVTNEEGNYEVPYLLPGVYKVTVEMPGFKTLVRDSVELRVNDRLTLDFMLQIGKVAESVVVTGETPLLESSSASIGMIMDERRVAELPMVGGNPLMPAWATRLELSRM